MTKRRAFIFIPLFIAALTLFAADVAKKVYVSGSGKKYHLKDCRTIKKAKKLTELTVQEAKDKGYEPCKVCKPPEK